MRQNGQPVAHHGRGPVPTAAYDEIADWYEQEFLANQQANDGMADPDPLGINHALRELLGNGSGTCLEIGCGTGVHAATVRKLGWTPVGVDLSAGMLRHARGRLATAQADAQQLPIRGGWLPAAIAVMVHTDMPGYPAVLAEAARVFRPGGVLVHVGVHPCFCGGFADRGERDAVVIRPGYLDGHWTKASWTDQGVRDKVGATHRPLPELLHGFLDTGLTLERFAEGGAPTPVMLAIKARKPPFCEHRPPEWDQQSLDAGGVLGSERCARHAGMQRVGGDEAALQPAGQLVGEQDVGELGLAVGPCAGPGTFALEVVEVDSPLGVRVGGDRDHAGWGALVQPVEEEIGEQERRQMVEGEGALEPVSGDVPGVPVPPDVVDQHIDPGEALEYLVSQPPHLRLAGQVRDEHVHLPAAGCADLASRALGAPAVPASDRQVRTHRGQAQGGRPADAAAATGDQHGPAGHRPAVDLLHVQLDWFSGSRSWASSSSAVGGCAPMRVQVIAAASTASSRTCVRVSAAIARRSLRRPAPSRALMKASPAPTVSATRTRRPARRMVPVRSEAATTPSAPRVIATIVGPLPSQSPTTSWSRHCQSAVPWTRKS